MTQNIREWLQVTDRERDLRASQGREHSDVAFLLKRLQEIRRNAKALELASEAWRFVPTEHVSQTGDDLVDRLRGLYTLPGDVPFVRRFFASPINLRAADEIERLRLALSVVDAKAQ